MDNPAPSRYPVENRELVAQAPGLRVQVLTLADGQCVPWHHHTRIDDHFFCLEGPMEVRTRDPDRTHVLRVGGRLSVPAGQVHRVAGVSDGRCRFALVQGVGEYDYVEA